MQINKYQHMNLGNRFWKKKTSSRDFPFFPFH